MKNFQTVAVMIRNGLMWRRSGLDESLELASDIIRITDE